MVRNILKGKGLPNKYWDEAVNIAAYILNKSLTTTIQNQIPFEARHKQSLMLVILKYLVVLLMLLFLLKVETSLIRKGRNLYLLTIVMNQKAFDFSILKRISYFYLGMLFFMNLLLEMGRFSQSQSYFKLQGNLIPILKIELVQILKMEEAYQVLMTNQTQNLLQ